MHLIHVLSLQKLCVSQFIFEIPGRKQGYVTVAVLRGREPWRRAIGGCVQGHSTALCIVPVLLLPEAEAAVSLQVGLLLLRV